LVSIAEEMIDNADIGSMYYDIFSGLALLKGLGFRGLFFLAGVFGVLSFGQGNARFRHGTISHIRITDPHRS
jgi:hypothetical protein